jgi:uncharacterized phage protein gp47/JayE
MMGYSVRALATISQSVRGAIRQYLPGTDASLKQNVLTVIGKVVSLLAYEYELRVAWLYNQLFLTSATSEAIVVLQAGEYGVLRKPAAAASGLISGSAAANGIYPSGVRFLSGAQIYVTIAPFVADALGAYTANVRAEKPGNETNRDAGAVLTLVDPSLYPDFATTAIVGAGGLGGGADDETVEDLRQRALRRKRTPPQGGALADYERFALEVPGVVNAWARKFANGNGMVGAWVLFKGRENGIPTPSDLATVQAYIDERRLVRVDFQAVAPHPSPVDIVLALSPDSTATRAAVTAALTAFFDATSPASRIRPSLPDDPFVLPLAWISEAVSTSPGEASHTIIEPAANLSFAPGEMPVLGAIAWA